MATILIVGGDVGVRRLIVSALSDGQNSVIESGDPTETVRSFLLPQAGGA
jgi:short-subunit dehydrogenase involved in D-alanine esterification of teichoic acids